MFQILLDLKDCIEKMTDLSNDLNNQVDDMLKTLEIHQTVDHGIFFTTASTTIDVSARLCRALCAGVSYSIAVSS